MARIPRAVWNLNVPSYHRASVRAARAATGACMKDWTRRRVCPEHDVVGFNLRTWRLGPKQKSVCRLDHELSVKGG
jgi:hypothetical protein